MNWVLIVVAMMGWMHDSGRSVHVFSERFRSEVACKSAAEFVVRDGVLRKRGSAIGAGKYQITAKCVRDVQ